MAEFLIAIAVSLVVAYLWRRVERTRLGGVLSWGIVYVTLAALVLGISASFGYVAWLALRAAH